MILMSHRRNLKKPTLYMREPALFGAVTRRVSARDAIVDVANMRPNNIADLAAEYGGRVAYVSTHKTFNYFRETGALPRPAPGTLWLVLRVPYEKRGTTREVVYDARAERFVSSRGDSPVRVRYHGNALCSIETRGSAAKTGQEHAFCEVDDLVIAHAGVATGLPVYTHDRMLGRIVAGAMPLPRLDLPMTRLMGATRLTALEFRDGRWVVAHRK